VDAAELAREVHRVVVAGLAGDGRDRQVGAVEEFAGPGHAQLHLELQRRDPEPFPEQCVELRGTEPHHRGERGDRGALGRRRPQVLGGAFERARSGSGIAPSGRDHLRERVPGGAGGPEGRGGGEPRVERVDDLRDEARDRGGVAQVRDRSAGRRVRGPDEVGGVRAGEVKPP
jgi:hypothetical protein